MPRHNPPHFRKNLIVLATIAMFAPYSAWALDLAESPPGTVEPYVRPNVIITLDDSGSMKYWIDATTSGTADGVDRTAPVNGTWPINTQRISVLKYAVKQVFNDINLLPDNKIRLAWQTMHNNGNSSGSGKNKFPGADNVNTKGKHNMRLLDSTHRNNFVDFVGWMIPNSGTPTHQMAYQAHTYMTTGLSKDGPWASDPGNTAVPYLGCRRNYHILMSDGGWQTAPSSEEKPGNADGANFSLPDGMPYNKVPPYADADAKKVGNTQYYDSVADWAFKSWSTKLQTVTDPKGITGLKGTMQPTADYRKAPAQENFGKDKKGKDAILDRYWNPRYNPATWPHMVTYTIGFSEAATTWSGEKDTIKRPPDTHIVPFSYDTGTNGSLPDFITGNITWPNLTTSTEKTKNPLDLWHAALNGRGRFYAVENGTDLEKAFREIFGQINTATDPDLNSSATSGSNVSRGEVGKYTAAYEPTNYWKGFVVADKVKPDGTTTPDPAWEGKNTADKLDALGGVGSRLVLGWSDKWDSTKYKGGVPFKWASDESNLSTAQKLWLQTNVGGTAESATKGEQRLNYIRGDQDLEGTEPNNYPPAKPYRQRKSRQGDIINSDVWYTGAPAGNSLLKGYSSFVRTNKSRSGMLYVGGNDGMLHGFAAANGEEKIAYVPRGMLPSLTLLTDPQYNNKHKYFVDGSPMTGDVDLNGGMQDPKDPNYGAYTASWRTMLVGTLGLGGKGYFVLDVTNPTATALADGTPGFTEANAQHLVKLDRTRGPTESAPNCAAITAGTEKTTCEQVVDEDKDIGYITARPVRDDNDGMRSAQITLMNNNRWAVVMGNGYNSTNQRPVLLVQYLDGNKELLRIPVTNQTAETGNAKDNGLAAPRLVDLNGDGRPDVLYAGDNLGNLWKFDLTSHLASDWKVAFGGSPLFTATGPAALGSESRPKAQAITAPPTTRANDRSKIVGTGASAKSVRIGGMMVGFGTGRNVSKIDPASVDVQTFYSVLDNTRYKEVTTSLGKRLAVHPGGGTCPAGADCVPAPAALGTGVTDSKLAKQVFIEVDGGDFGAIKPADAANDLKPATWANFNGWYLDMPAVGERLLKPIDFYDASNLLTFWSQVPAKGSDVDPNVESCDSTAVDAERQYRTFVNIMDGKAPSVQLVDKNNNGKFNMADGDGVFSDGKYIGISRKKVSKGPHTIISTGKDENVDIDSKNNTEKLASMPEESLRPSWRQLR